MTPRVRPAAWGRRDVDVVSGRDRCRGWMYLPAGRPCPPVVVLGHGAGGTRGMGLDAYAERFAAAGLAVLVFTYRHFGESDGEPRQLLSVGRQLEDWDAALAFVATLPEVDGAHPAIWGSSLGGGHALPGYLALAPRGSGFVNEVPARALPQLAAYRPGRSARSVAAPLLVCISDTDSVAPPRATRRHVRRAPHVELHHDPAGHFAFYRGEPFERLVARQTEFLVRHLAVPA